jgi:hypothetical protein
MTHTNGEMKPFVVAQFIGHLDKGLNEKNSNPKFSCKGVMR